MASLPRYRPTVSSSAKGAEGQLFQIEIQIVHYHYLVARMLHNWAHIFSHQLLEGAEYSTLKPTYAIWLVCKSVFSEDTDYAHTIRFRDDQGRIPMKHGGIWIFELQKFHAQQIANEQQRWLRFFKEGDQLNDAALPDWMSTAIMRQVMSTLRHFSESEKEYFAYQDRVNYVREQLTIQQELDANQKEIERNRRELAIRAEKLRLADQEIQQAKQQIQKIKQRERETQQEAAVAKAEIESLKALLALHNR